MRLLVLIMFFLLSTPFCYAQKDLLTAKTRKQLEAQLDSALLSKYYITLSDAEKILEKPAFLKDSTYKLSGGLLRYSFDYIAKSIDSTSKGKISFSLEQYKDTAISKSNYDFIKKQNEKDGAITLLENIGNDAFLKMDNLNQPFVMILKDNKIYRFRVFYLSSQSSLDALLSVSKKIVSNE
jgi:hypothetical protein